MTRGPSAPTILVTFNPDRLLHPLRRTGKKGEGRFERVSWDEALGEVADRLKKVIAEHGGAAVLPYSYAGTEGLVQHDALSSRFFARMGASRLERNVCGGAGYEGVAATLGTGMGMLPQDAAWSRLVVVWGANPMVTNAHGWPFVLEAKKKGARLVVIDPLRSRTAEEAHSTTRATAASRARARPRESRGCRSTPRTRRRGTSGTATRCAPTTTGARYG
ncbi:MAG TPA: molybdopterin-dependent oxidoreductase [Vicinamibacteria bacterium]|nr:molybdopterin-dependent oxidoreductase [Vicinamibacteria bacterium]